MIWVTLAFPWYEPAGCVVAFVLAHVLARSTPRLEALGPAADARS